MKSSTSEPGLTQTRELLIISLRVITRGTNETRVSFSDYRFKSVLFKC